MDTQKLKELNDLFQQGKITEAEFLREKKKLYDGEFRNQSTSLQEETDLPLGLSEKSYLCLMNLIILLPSAGWIISILLWVAGKDKSPEINNQGKWIINWLITWAILLFGCAGLITVSFIGAITISPTAIAGSLIMIPVVFLGLAGFIFPIVGAIKSSEGKAFRYPLSIRFLK